MQKLAGVLILGAADAFSADLTAPAVPASFVAEINSIKGLVPKSVHASAVGQTAPRNPAAWTPATSHTTQDGLGLLARSFRALSRFFSHRFETACFIPLLGSASDRREE